MSSGKDINRPSDDPYRAGRAIGLRTDLEGMAQHERNIDEALGWQTVTDTALTTITKFSQRARELVVQGATDTLSQSDRNAIAQEIDQIIAGMKQEANATYDGRYVFAGTSTSTRPYDSTARDGQRRLLGRPGDPEARDRPRRAAARQRHRRRGPRRRPGRPGRCSTSCATSPRTCAPATPTLSATTTSSTSTTGSTTCSPSTRASARA